MDNAIIEQLQSEVEQLKMKITVLERMLEPIMPDLKDMKSTRLAKEKAARKPKIPTQTVTINGAQFAFRKASFNVLVNGRLQYCLAEDIVSDEELCASIHKNYAYLFSEVEEAKKPNPKSKK